MRARVRVRVRVVLDGLGDVDHVDGLLVPEQVVLGEVGVHEATVVEERAKQRRHLLVRWGDN